MAEALRYDDRESQLHNYGGERVGSGRESAAFHGHGVAKDFDAVDQARFLQLVDTGLREVVGDGNQPLVLAGTEEIVSRFRNLSDHRGIVDGSIGGNPERLSPDELHEEALPLVQNHLDAARHEARALMVSPSTPTTESLDEAIEAAANGRVAMLVVAEDHQEWGTFDADNRIVDHHHDRMTGDDDLVDVAARLTLERSGGDVVTIAAEDMPEGASLCAVLRY